MGRAYGTWAGIAALYPGMNSGVIECIVPNGTKLNRPIPNKELDKELILQGWKVKEIHYV